MAILDVLIIVLVSVLGTWVVSYFILKNSLKKYLQLFLDSHHDIVFLYDDKGLKLINKVGLNFFGYKKLEDFLSVHSDVSDFFIEERGCIDKYTYGKHWIETIVQDVKNKDNRVKVKIFSEKENFEYYFYIKISKLINTNEYLLFFNDITKLEYEKSGIKKSAELDPLTKIYNRVKLNEMFVNIFFNANKYNHVITMILFDIDHFKRINDDFGHNVGDKVLQELAGLIRGLLRDGDIFARWGGEEFVIVLQNISLEQTTKLASRLRSEIEKYSFAVVENVTCSFGVTEFSHNDRQEEFFERVDEALYEAKESGRNRVVTKKVSR